MELKIIATQNGLALSPPCPPLLAKINVIAHDLPDESARIMFLIAPDGTAIGAGSLVWNETASYHEGFLTTWTTEAQAYVDSVSVLRPPASFQIAKHNNDGSVTPDVITPVRCLISNMLSTPSPTPAPLYLTQSMFADITERLAAADTLGNTKSIINELLNILTGTTP